MSGHKNTLGLNVPSLSKPTQNSFDIRPKKVAAWIHELPLTNLGETARKVFTALSEINRLEIPPDYRIKIMEQFRSPVRYIATNLSKYYIGVPFPLNPKNRKIAHLCRELEIEMAMGYKLIINHFPAEKISILNKKLLVIANHRALRYMGRIFLQSALIYENTPASFWKDVHALYLYTERHAIHQISVKEEEEQQTTNLTVEEIYKQILLMFLSSPSRLRQRDIQQICRLVSNWTAYLKILKPSNGECHGLFFVDLQSDNPPAYTQFYQQQPKKFCRQLDTTALVKYLQIQQQQSHKPSLNRLDPSLLSRLLHAWSHIPKRSAPRTEEDNEIEIILGLNAIYKIMTSKIEMDEEGSIELPESKIDHDWLEDITDLRKDYSIFERDDSLSLSPVDDSRQLEPEYVNPWANSKQAKTYKCVDPTATLNEETTFPCRIINASSGGYCLLWYSSNPPKARIGELVGIESENTMQYSIGVLRWMKNQPKQGMLFGIQLLSQQSIATKFYLSNQKSKAQNGILLPAVPKRGKLPSLLMVSPDYKGGMILFITDGKIEVRIRLTKLIESTGSFSQFQYSELDSVNIEQGLSASQEDNEEDFDSVWSLI